MQNIVIILHILTAIALIGFILLQQGKGAEAGASFGAGASQTIFGSQGSGSLMTRITAILATTFFMTSIALGYITLHVNKPEDLDKLIEKTKQEQSIQQQNQGSQDSQGTQNQMQQEEIPSLEELSRGAKPTNTKADQDIPKIPMNTAPDKSNSEKIHH